MKTGITRRKLVGLATVMFVGGGVVGNAVMASGANTLADNLASHTELKNLSNLRALGRQCMSFLPDNEATLMAVAGVGTSGKVEDQLSGFASKRQDDFLSGRIHTVDGWVMAEAECAFCVLCALA